MSNYANAIDNYSREQSGISNFASNYKQGVSIGGPIDLIEEIICCL